MEKYQYYLVGNALPFFEKAVPADMVERASLALRTMYTCGLPTDHIELQARFNGGWLTLNPENGEFE